MAAINEKIILASTSPRRRKLLAEAGYNFDAVSPKFTEPKNAPAGIDARQFAIELALSKALSVIRQYPENLVLGADTLVDCNGHIIGKAHNASQAEQITKKIFSAPHKVITAVAIVRAKDNLRITDSDTTVVYPRPMSRESLRIHIQSRGWQGKAGAYAIKEHGDEFIEKIDGSLTNVMGLPMELLARLLTEIVTT